MVLYCCSTCPAPSRRCIDSPLLQAVLIGERITGQGAVQQFEVSNTNVPLWVSFVG